MSETTTTAAPVHDRGVTKYQVTRHGGPTVGVADSEDKRPAGGLGENPVGMRPRPTGRCPLGDTWRRTSPAPRRDLLLRLGELIGKNQPELTRIAALENGSPVIGGPHYVDLSVNWLTYYAGWADKLQGSVAGSFIQGTDFTYSQPEPYGVIGAIITWNVPRASLCMKVVPALAAGNTVVVKPSELTPFSAEMFARLAEEAGMPAGVITVVPGTAEAGQALVAHPKVQKISFTGGPATARKILATCAEHLKPSVMELGGKSANIIFADADLDKAASEAIRMGLSALSGQACILGSRVLVQDSVAIAPLR